MNEAAIAKDKFADWTVAEILKAKARWIHACLAAILPPPLYELAKQDKDLNRVRKWCKDQGYAWKEVVGQSELYKGPILVSFFRPILKGEREDRHMEFYVQLNGREIDLDGHVIVLTA